VHHRKILLSLAAVAVAGVGVGTAVAATETPASRRVTISTPATEAYKINRYVQFGLRWNRDAYTIRSGGTLVFKNVQSDEPHTFSILRKNQLPRTKRRLNQCGAEPPATPRYAPCRAIFQAHAPDAQGNPQNAVVNKGRPGIDAPGDSVFIPPKGSPQPTIRVSARRGRTLYFICLVHPWMQASLRVR
jgi:hypothetical protein